MPILPAELFPLIVEFAPLSSKPIWVKVPRPLLERLTDAVCYAA